MSKTVPSPTAPRVEIYQRSRMARLRLDQLEGLVVPRVRQTQSWLRQGLYRLRPSMGPRPSRASVRAGSRVVVERAICFAGGADTEVIGPPASARFNMSTSSVVCCPLPALRERCLKKLSQPRRTVSELALESTNLSPGRQ
jgi:hypothetical protein